MAVSKRTWDPWKMYDASADEIRAVRERAKVREELKAKWTKQATNPLRGAHDGGYLFDPACQRFISLKATQYEYFKGTHRSMLVTILVFVLPVLLTTRQIVNSKKEQEKLIRSGGVQYKDRQLKFMY